MKRVTVQFLSSLLCIVILFASCATLFNKPSHKVYISTDIDTDGITVNDQPRKLTEGEVTILVEREKAPLIIVIGTNDSVKPVIIKNRNSFTYIYYAITTAGLSTIIEKNNPKRYYHQKNIYLGQAGDSLIIRRFAPLKKGTVHFMFGFPYANHFSIKANDTRRDKAGFLGLSVGSEYAHRQNQYLSLQAAVAIDNEIPAPAAVEHFDDSVIYTRAYSFYGNIRNNHVLRSFEAGYGLSFSRFGWRRTISISPNDTTQIERSYALGLSLSAQYRMTRRLRIGIMYQPSFFRIDHGLKSVYQHFLSAELLFKFRVRKGK